jgi:phage shock protein PspC (stress-responsive transcriptional regulator)
VSPISMFDVKREDCGMEQETTSTAESSEARTGPTELLRPREGRVLAGVSQGLADRFDLPNWALRAFFVVTAFFGGLGLALYAAGWALIRSDDETESPAERFFDGASSTKSWVGIGLIFVAALILLENLTFFSGGVVFAAGLLIVGVLLYLGHIPLDSGGGKSKEGVQPMTTTDTLVSDTDSTAGDSPAGGGTPPTPTPTPPLLPPSAAKPKERSILGRITIGVMLLAMGVLAILDNLSGVPIDAEPRHYLALAATILGVGLLVGAFIGRARWLIVVAVVLLPTLLLSPVFEYEWESESFDVVHQPASFNEIQEFYELDLGNMVIDLTELPWDGRTVDIDAQVDVGNLEIRIPSTVGISGFASVDVGRVGAPGRESSGLGNPNLEFDQLGELGTVNLDAQVDLGNIDIEH